MARAISRYPLDRTVDNFLPLAVRNPASGFVIAFFMKQKIAFVNASVQTNSPSVAAVADKSHLRRTG
ncbi:hypothetical protein [Maritimibacter dapengensis]|uniref:Uncharacterized protein n=1 Tax=Maritimibacter dapengensis TaxID=2836868 RepID=A0ABS6T3S3_9RHOB|nr:hypothetical protein [Maritimibacter dapengensis]MBV7379872.1 hypothetical protein [Maritimibacter dapengensis]